MMKTCNGNQKLRRPERRYQQACGPKAYKSFETRQTMYNALIFPYFDYSSCVGGYIGKGLVENPQKLQNIELLE